MRRELSSASNARVLAVFERACQLLVGRDDIVALVMPVVGDGPLNVVVDAPPGAWAQLAVQQPGEIKGGLIQLGSLAIDLRGAAVWEPCPDWAQLALHGEQVRANARWLAARLSEPNATPAPGLLALLHPQAAADAPPSWAATLDAARQAARALLAAIASNDCTRACAAASSLAGLGGGLTPSGDDFIIGVLAWLWLSENPPGPPPLCGAIAQAAAGKTSTLSAALLQAAGRGEFSASWHALFEALAGGSQAEIQPASQRVLQYGHTSGADALAGFVMAAR